MACHSCHPTFKVSGRSVTAEMRAPAYPLITVDPYMSAWSCGPEN
jgi:hypothetical protein